MMIFPFLLLIIVTLILCGILLFFNPQKAEGLISPYFVVVGLLGRMALIVLFLWSATFLYDTPLARGFPVLFFFPVIAFMTCVYFVLGFMRWRGVTLSVLLIWFIASQVIIYMTNMDFHSDNAKILTISWCVGWAVFGVLYIVSSWLVKRIIYFNHHGSECYKGDNLPPIRND